MELWDYQVIHLNVEGPAPGAQRPQPPPGKPAPEPPATPPQPVFSKEYLEKEFPGFYGDTTPSDPASGTSRSDHPAVQLRNFLNHQGREGWQLLGFYPVGQLTMMIFRRPRPAAAAGAAAVSATPQPGCAGPPGPLEGGQTPPPAADLQTVLSRLEALERRLPPEPGDPAAPPLSEADPLRDPQALAELADGDVLPQTSLQQLARLPRCSTARAAQALGFRSAASLLNLAARRGYAPGLLKLGANGLMAVYVGTERSASGGRERRLWVVLREAPPPRPEPTA